MDFAVSEKEKKNCVYIGPINSISTISSATTASRVVPLAITAISARRLSSSVYIRTPWERERAKRVHYNARPREAAGNFVIGLIGRRLCCISTGKYIYIYTYPGATTSIHTRKLNAWYTSLALLIAAMCVCVLLLHKSYYTLRERREFYVARNSAVCTRVIYIYI